jgi:hypothetical protein
MLRQPMCLSEAWVPAVGRPSQLCSAGGGWMGEPVPNGCAHVQMVVGATRCSGGWVYRQTCAACTHATQCVTVNHCGRWQTCNHEASIHRCVLVTTHTWLCTVHTTWWECEVCCKHAPHVHAIGLYGKAIQRHVAPVWWCAHIILQLWPSGHDPCLAAAPSWPPSHT